MTNESSQSFCNSDASQKVRFARQLLLVVVVVVVAIHVRVFIVLQGLAVR